MFLIHLHEEKFQKHCMKYSILIPNELSKNSNEGISRNLNAFFRIAMTNLASSRRFPSLLSTDPSCQIWSNNTLLWKGVFYKTIFLSYLFSVILYKIVLPLLYSIFKSFKVLANILDDFLHHFKALVLFFNLEGI